MCNGRRFSKRTVTAPEQLVRGCAYNNSVLYLYALFWGPWFQALKCGNSACVGVRPGPFPRVVSSLPSLPEMTSLDSVSGGLASLPEICCLFVCLFVLVVWCLFCLFVCCLFVCHRFVVAVAVAVAACSV